MDGTTGGFQAALPGGMGDLWDPLGLLSLHLGPCLSSILPLEAPNFAKLSRHNLALAMVSERMELWQLHPLNSFGTKVYKRAIFMCMMTIPHKYGRALQLGTPKMVALSSQMVNIG